MPAAFALAAILIAADGVAPKLTNTISAKAVSVSPESFIDIADAVNRDCRAFEVAGNEAPTAPPTFTPLADPIGASGSIDRSNPRAYRVEREWTVLRERGRAVRWILVCRASGETPNRDDRTAPRDVGDPCTTDPECDDSLYCNGAETCVADECAAGTPVDCASDGIFCNGVELCWEDTDECVHSGNPCADDGLFCNGDEVCDEVEFQCLHGGDPCADDGAYCNGAESCNETDDACESSGDPCDDGLFCTGVETCDEVADDCLAGTSPCADDAIFCNGTESCDDAADACTHSGDPCTDNGAFCDGTESCDEETAACVSSGSPCADDGLWCTGTESCDESTGQCTTTGSPCGSLQICDEDEGECLDADLATPTPEGKYGSYNDNASVCCGC